LERNPLFTKERALFYYEKTEYYYKNKAYSQALSEIEKNKDLLGAVLNVGKQLSLNRINTNSIINVMIDIFEVDGNIEYFDECFNKYRTTLELHAEPKTYILLHTYFTEKNKNQNLASKDVRLCQTVEDTIGQYIDKTEIISSGIKQKNSKAKSIEEDFLNSIGRPFMASQDMKEAVKTEDRLLYGSNDDFETLPSVELTADEKEAFLTDASLVFDEESSSLQNNDLPKTAPEKKISEVDIQISNIEKELELQNQLANKTTSDVQLNSKDKKSPVDLSPTLIFEHEQMPIKKAAKKQVQTIKEVPEKNEKSVSKSSKSSNGSPQYLKNHTVSKSGGKVTELEFKHTDEQIPKIKKQDSEIRNNAPELKRQTKKTSGAHSKKTKKKKSSKIPVVISVVVALIFMLVAFGLIKSGILNKPEISPENLAISDNNAPDKNTNGNDDSASTKAPDSTATDTPVPDGSAVADASEIQADSEYILPSDTKLLTLDDLEGMDKSKVRFAINEMYARRGWHFDHGGDYYTYFSEKSWYKPDSKLQTPSDASAGFTETENVNLATIIKYRDTLS